MITQAIGGLTVLIAVYANYKVLSSSPFAHHEGTSFIRSLTIASILALMMAGAASTITFSYWHLILIFAFALLPILVLFENSHRIRTVHIVYLALAMIVMNLISALNSDKFNIHASYTDQVNYLCLQKYEAAQCGLSEPEAKELSSRQLDSIFFGDVLKNMSATHNSVAQPATDISTATETTVTTAKDTAQVAEPSTTQVTDAAAAKPSTTQETDAAD